MFCMVWFWISGQMAVLDCLEVWYTSVSPNYESGSAIVLRFGYICGSASVCLKYIETMFH